MKGKSKNEKKYDYDVALSFVGEDRKYVERIANRLREMDIKVFYDKFEEVTLWGKNLYTYLREIYQNKAKYTVMFISKNYAKKVWTNHERESAQARAFTENKEYILPARFDNTKIPGELSTIGYIDLTKKTPNVFSELIKEKIGQIERINYNPNNPDRLFNYLNIKKNDEKDLICKLSNSFFEDFRLMTPFEREVLVEAILNSCPNGPPENVHLGLEYYSRLVSLKKEELIRIYSRLDCLRIKSKLYKTKVGQKKIDKICGSGEIIEIKYEIFTDYFSENATFIMIAIIDILHDHLCPKCFKNAIQNVDFSILSYDIGISEKKEKTRKKTH